MVENASNYSAVRERITTCGDFYRAFFDKGNDGVFIVSHGINQDKSLFVDVNRKGHEMFGYTKEEILSLSFGDIVLQDHPDSFTLCSNVSKREEGCVSELACRKKNGDHVLVEISSQTFIYMGVTITLASVRDQTAKNVYLKKIENATEEWRNTFDSISDFVSVHDKDFKFTRVNRALADFLGVDPQEILGKYCYEVMHGTDSPWPNCPHKQILHSGETVTEVIEDSGIGVPLLVQCSPCFDKEKKVLGSVHVARDITREREVEKEKEELISQLNVALDEVKKLSGFLPICASCKKIRDDEGDWTQIESYISKRSEAEFSHGMCPDCMKRFYPNFKKG